VKEPRGPPIENTSGRGSICSRVNIDTPISAVIYYSASGVRDNILHAATSYFMQKAVKHKRPRIVFDDSPPRSVFYGEPLALGFPARLRHSSERNRRFLRNIK